LLPLIFRGLFLTGRNDRINVENHEFDGTQHYNNNTYASVAIAQIQDGEYKTVWPFEYSVQEIVYPAEYR